MIAKTGAESCVVQKMEDDWDPNEASDASVRSLLSYCCAHILFRNNALEELEEESSNNQEELDAQQADRLLDEFEQSQAAWVRSN